MIFDKYFDRIVIISLPRCADRAARAMQELRDKGLSETAVVVRAVDGQVCEPSDWWTAGRGAWGCMQSHYRVVMDALQDGIEKLLVIEDDCIWQNDAGRLAAEFLEQVPEEWGQVYFGGQHRSAHRPEWVEGKPAVFKARSIHRTHCYGIRRGVMGRFLKHISYAPDYISAAKGPKPEKHHVDHQLERAHRRGDWPVYCPSFWLAGQGENDSAINGRKNIPAQWWHLSWREAHRKLPVVLCEGPVSPEQARWLHFGRHLDEKDATIDKGVRDAPVRDDVIRMMELVAEEALGMQRLPAMHAWPQKAEWLRERWAGPVMELPGADELARLCDYPASRVMAHRWIAPRAAAEVKEAPGSGEAGSTKAEARPLWLFSTPRSGSTLLMRMLAGAEGIRFGGETRDLLWKAKSLHDERAGVLAEYPDAADDLEGRIAAGAFPAWRLGGGREEWDEAVRGVLRGWGGAAAAWSWWGWKEVGIGRAGGGAALWRWLVDLFPEARLLFLTRHPDRTLASMMAKVDWFIPAYGRCLSDMERKLMTQRAAFAEFAAEAPGNCVTLDYEELIDAERLLPKLAAAGVDIGMEVWEREAGRKIG